MTNLHAELVAGYVTAGWDKPDLDDRRLARALYVRNLIRTVREADKKFGISPADTASLAQLVDAAEDYLEQICRNIDDTLPGQHEQGASR